MVGNCFSRAVTECISFPVTPVISDTVISAFYGLAKYPGLERRTQELLQAPSRFTVRIWITSFPMLFKHFSARSHCIRGRRPVINNPPSLSVTCL